MCRPVSNVNTRHRRCSFCAHRNGLKWRLINHRISIAFVQLPRVSAEAQTAWPVLEIGRGSLLASAEASRRKLARPLPVGGRELWLRNLRPPRSRSVYRHGPAAVSYTHLPSPRDGL